MEMEIGSGPKCQIDGDSEDTPSRRRGHWEGRTPWENLSADALHSRSQAAREVRTMAWRSCFVFGGLVFGLVWYGSVSYS